VSETAGHLELVRLIVNYIRARHTRDGILILTDTAGTPVDLKPYRIGGFVPDVYAVDVPRTICIVGEAKVIADLETDHSRAQLEAFLQHLKLSDHGTLVVAVPWRASVTARRMIAGAVARLDAHNVEVVVLDAVHGATC
jgi:hypothetical protein